MIDISIIENLAHDPTLSDAVADILAGLDDLPPEDRLDGLLSAKYAVGSGAWGLPEPQQFVLLDAIGRACA